MTRTQWSVRLCLLCGIAVWAGAALSSEVSAQGNPSDSFTMIVLSSTYENQDVLAKQTQWVREHAKEMNVVLVVHMGDSVKDNTEREWQRVETSAAALDGVVPYLPLAGNHESFVTEGTHVGNRDTTMLNKHMPISRFSDKPWYGGSLDGRTENMYFLMDVGAAKYLVLSMEFAPRVEILDWANRVTTEHADRRAIIVTHSYTQSGDSKLNFKLDPLKYNQANTNRDEMWERFVRKHGNIFLVLSSHYFAVRRETSIGDQGNQVHQVMASYLDDERKAGGFLRIVRFAPKQGKIEFRTYSPSLDAYLTDDANQFELPYASDR